jgi:hypothetical protein
MYKHRRLIILLGFWVVCFWVVLILLGCSAALYLPKLKMPARNVQKADLIGVWYVNYKDYTRGTMPLCNEKEALRLTEILFLEDGGNYRQILWDQEKGKIEERKGTWWLESLSDGVVRVHLKGGRSYPHENCGYRSLGYFDDLTGHELIVDTTKEAVLQVWVNQIKGDLYLAYPFVRDPDAPVIVRLCRLAPR